MHRVVHVRHLRNAEEMVLVRLGRAHLRRQPDEVVDGVACPPSILY
jgi:hypothetical protein